MAIAFAEVATKAWADTQNPGAVTIDVSAMTISTDDLLIAVVGETSDSGGLNLSTPTPTGWSLLGSQKDGGDECVISVLYKYAVLADESATSYTINGLNNDVWGSGAVYRFTGAGRVPLYTDATGTGGTSAVFATSNTPELANSMLLHVGVAEANSSSGSASAYAIATDNPTWTERVDLFGDASGFFGAGDGDGLMWGATATRTETTATGNQTCTVTMDSSSETHVGALIIMAPQTDINCALDTAGSVLLSGPSVDVQFDLTIPMAIENPLTLSGPAFTVYTEEYLVFGNQSKNSTTWTNQSKS